MGISEGQWNLLRSRQTSDVETITANDSGVAVPAGRVLYGIDASGCRHLLVPVHGEVVQDHESQGVRVGVRCLLNEGKETLYADLACMMPRFNAEFAHIVDDVLHELGAGAPPHSVCRNALEKWRDLLLRADRKGRLDEGEAAGLFGELLLLRDLVTISPNAVRSWTGPGGGRFDFSVSDAAIEVKTSARRYGRLVEISGETQLDAPAGLALHLLFVRIEPVRAGGSSLWDLYTSIIESGASPRAMQQKLNELDLDEPVLMHDERRYRVLESRLYRVEGSFPRIVPASFTDGELPPGTLRLRYLIDLSGEPPVPLDPAAKQSVFQKIFRGDTSVDPP